MRLLLFFGIFVQISGLSHHRNTRSITNGDNAGADAYLKKYGYMSKFKSFTSTTEADRSVALRGFQKFNNLPVTGKLDEATIKTMNMPRCGCPDVELNADGTPKPFRLGPKWNKKSLTWRLNNFTPDLANSVVRSEIARAFKIWSDVADLTFTEVTASGNVDIDISFETGDHGDGAAFDGRFGVLAHAFFPQVGTTHFDEDETWVANRTGIDLFIVAAHEFGHALGLDHSEVSGALMAPTYTGYIPDFQLRPDDIAGIRAHYGDYHSKSIDKLRMIPWPSSDSGAATATQAPTVAPTVAPTNAPTAAPTNAPTAAPTNAPTAAPTNAPTAAPTNAPTAAPTNAPTAGPTNPPTTRPRICDITFNAATRATNGDILAFVGRRYVLVMDEFEGLVRAARTNRLFRRAPRRPSAAFTIPSTGNTYFIRGRRMYQFNENGLRTRMFWIRGGRSSMPEAPRAALAVSAEEIYIFGSTQVWQFDPSTRRVVANSHQLISTKFPGIPNRLDSAMMFDSSTVYFFKGNQYYLYDWGIQTLLGGPSDATSQFIKQECTLSK